MEANSKVIVITGASSGIGAATARLLGAAGHHLVLAARRGDALTAVAREAGDARPVITDVRRRGDVERLRDETIGAFGRVDVWISNAGRGISKPTLELTDDEFDEMMTVNVKSALYGMQAIVPYFMAQGRGHVLNVSSVLGRVPIATIRSAYSAAKAALNSLTANVRVDLKSYPNIHITLVMPGLVTTEFATQVMGDRARQGAVVGAPPPGVRPQTPEQVAAVIAGVIEHPVPEVYTNPVSADLVRTYYHDVGAFEAGR
jgi:NADP-dependent 3-hydroxy acid dehydrogenase YdfG